MGRKCWHPIWVVVLDVCLVGAALCVFSLFHHVLPMADTKTEYVSTMTRVQNTVEIEKAPEEPVKTEIQTAEEPELPQQEPPAEPEQEPEQGWRSRFGSYFSPEQVIAEPTRYCDANVSVSLFDGEKDGSHYYVENIYVADIDYLCTALARDTYGRGFTQMTSEIAREHQAAAAINGDYYGATNTSLVIRNGILYSDVKDGNICVLFADGTMEAFEAGQYDLDALIERGIWQAWSFGPSLLDENGHAMEQFVSTVKKANPRTAIGYYEPGHYCFVTVDGRSEESGGMTMTQLSQLMEDLGCSFAYNLDGGKTSMMVLNDQVVNQPVDGGRKCSDIVYVKRTDLP